jgi:tetratricopeptide (TPR) repeat protein
MLTGQPPFRASSVWELLQQIQNWLPVSPRKLSTDTPVDLATICLKCLEKDPRQRYATARDLHEDLDRFLSGRPVLARPIGPMGRLHRWSQRNPAMAGLLTSIVLLVGSALTALTVMNVKIRHETVAKSHALQQESVAKRNAERAEKEAKEALSAETATRKRARDALDTLTDSVVEKLLTGKPKLDDEERSFLAKVAELYEPFSNVDSDRATSETRLAAARAQLRLGTIHSTLGNSASAEKWFRLAEQQLLDDRSESPEASMTLADVRSNLAILLKNSGDKEAGVQVLRRQVQELKSLADRFPGNVNARRNLAVSCLNLVIALGISSATVDECEALANTALANLEVDSRDPECPAKVLLYISSCYNNLGACAMIRGDDASAEMNLKLALSAREQLAARLPRDVDTQVYLSNTLDNLAQLQLNRHSIDEAEATYTRAIEVIEAVVHQFPGNPIYRQKLASLLARHGEMLMQDRPAIALEQFDRAFAVLSVAPPPGDLAEIANKMVRGVQTRRATTLDRLQRTAEAEAAWEQLDQSAPPEMKTENQLNRALALVQSGSHRHAAEIAEQISEQKDVSDDVIYNCACVFALASAAATDDAELQARTAARAVELLRRIKAGYFDAARLEHMKHDPDLDSLRQRTDYEAWLAEMEGR